LEIRVANGYQSVADVDDMVRSISLAVSGLAPEQKFVIAADWRAVNVMSPETSARARTMMLGNNARVRRSSILTADAQSTTQLQVLRLVREADNENRRHFTSAREQHAWLCEVLTPQESSRLSEFLGLTRAIAAP
jgi:hypothetical protein